MYVSRNGVDFVDFYFHSLSTLKILNIFQNIDMYMLRNVVDLVDFDFHSHIMLKILNICVSEKMVD